MKTEGGGELAHLETKKPSFHEAGADFEERAGAAN